MARTIRTGSRLSWLVDSALLCAVALSVLTMLSPGRSLESRFSAWRTQRAVERALATGWGDLRSGSARLGGSTTPDVVEFADYQCPFCRESHAVIQAFLAKHPTVSLGFRHTPINELHPAAEGAARAAICAERQGQFDAMHDYLMTTDQWEVTRDWQGLATFVPQVDGAEFGACLNSRGTDERLADDRAWAERLGLEGTPIFVADGRVHQGVVESIEELERLAFGR